MVLQEKTILIISPEPWGTIHLSKHHYTIELLNSGNRVRMIFGFALVAYPAEYGSSGIMTFMVNQSGMIYENDLGEDTEKLAMALNVYDPDPTWKKAEAQ